MKKILIALLTVMPLLASAQDNTWERIEVEEKSKDNPDAKYLVPNAVPEVDGMVKWQTTLTAEGKTADDYDTVDALTGATISSKAYKKAIENAFKAYDAVTKEAK